MTNTEAVKKLKGLTNNDFDNEQVHLDADEILLEVLEAYGCEDVAKAYVELQDTVTFWYA